MHPQTTPSPNSPPQTCILSPFGLVADTSRVYLQYQRYQKLTPTASRHERLILILIRLLDHTAIHAFLLAPHSTESM